MLVKAVRFLDRVNVAILSNVAFLTFNFLAFKFTGFLLGLRLNIEYAKKATLDKKAVNVRISVLSTSALYPFKHPHFTCGPN